ncbi:tRNA (5-methylaminomethyl-2-thiouridine)(34)-methyltransferase MnmD [Ottowia sp. SB7-C50]|uniref:tRNA (5-methylaminomethyl-2-thiouridine)(34)-methyltransferase MnmD n=1 Tax=Ottowia sp. SB7-C50 TaxID=3081231 RepID=UPI0029553E1C|nr:MnmC family methyltransferase [Ottowia sp. SB7-C50]WOP14102.1 MnmC family methyltransferase [Ottowia sp. SB7-C50]
MPDDTGHGHDDRRPLDPSLDDVAPQVEGQAASALAEARGLFLSGCGLLDEGAQPAVWRGVARWAVLEAGFDHGLHFLATWAAWRQQAQRPTRLFYTAVMAAPPEAQALIGSAARFADLAPLASELAAQWHGLLPGVHRLRLDGGRVQLTLAIGEVQPLLADITGEYDSIFFDGLDPDSDWGSLHTLKALARLARPGTRVAAACGDDALRERLAACGFNVGADTDPRALRATYAPRWTPRSRRDAFAPPPW